jgi:hypothetical protein
MTRGIPAAVGVAVVAITLLVAACSDEDTPPDAGGGATQPPAVTSTLPPGPPTIGTPSDLPATVAPTPSAGTEDCGVEDQGPLLEHDPVVRECLWNAYTAGRPAILTTTISTIEGDPIIWHIAVVSPDEIRVSVDNTADRFGGPNAGIQTYTCTSMEQGSDPELPTLLVFSGCDTEDGSDVAL